MNLDFSWPFQGTPGSGGWRRGEKAAWWESWGRGCRAKLQLISIDLLVFGSFAKIRPYLAPEPLAASVDVLQRFLPSALSSFILVNIKIWAQKTENELLIFQYCLNLQLNWRSGYVLLSKANFCYSWRVSGSKVSLRGRAQVYFGQSTKGEYATQHFQTFPKENWGKEKTDYKVIGLDVGSFTKEREKIQKESGREREGQKERVKKGSERDECEFVMMTNKLSP